MKTREEIEKALLDLKKIWSNADYVPDYIRGQIAMLEWVLR